jgi:hypothetical protein
VVVPNKPSTEGAAVDDKWTQHCLDLASRRALTWGILGVLAFVSQLVLVFGMDVTGPLPVVLLAFSVVVFATGLRRRTPLEKVMGDEPWHCAKVRWKAGRLVVHGDRSAVFDLRGANPLVRGRITRHRRAWLVEPDTGGNTVITFRGVPRLFPAKVVTISSSPARRTFR